MFVECPAGSHYYHPLRDCYYVVETEQPLAEVNKECRKAYGVQSSMIGISNNSTLEDRMELYFHMDKLINTDGYLLIIIHAFLFVMNAEPCDKLLLSEMIK